jgi:hypothetical protein
MLSAKVSSKEVGAQCWSALRFTGRCYKCDRYDVCNYRCRVPDQTYDEKRALARKLKEESDKLYRELKDL